MAVDVETYFKLHKPNQKIELDGLFILKNPCNGSFAWTIDDEIKTSIKTKTNSIKFGYGYSLQEIAGIDEELVTIKIIESEVK